MAEIADSNGTVIKDIDQLIAESEAINKNNGASELINTAENRQAAPPPTPTPGEPVKEQPPAPEPPPQPQPAAASGPKKDKETTDEELEWAIDVYVVCIETLCELTLKEKPDIPEPLTMLTKTAFVFYARSHQLDIKKIMDKMFWVLFFSIPVFGAISSVRKKQAKKLMKQNIHETKSAFTEVINDIKANNITNSENGKLGCQCPKCQGKVETRGRHHLNCPCVKCQLERIDNNLKTTEIEFEEIKDKK